MSYFDGNPYREPITRVLHDRCMNQHPERFQIIDGTPFQVAPWHWAPLWSVKPGTACDDCGADVFGFDSEVFVPRPTPLPLQVLRAYTRAAIERDPSAAIEGIEGSESR